MPDDPVARMDQIMSGQDPGPATPSNAGQVQETNEPTPGAPTSLPQANPSNDDPVARMDQIMNGQDPDQQPSNTPAPSQTSPQPSVSPGKAPLAPQPVSLPSPQNPAPLTPLKTGPSAEDIGMQDLADRANQNFGQNFVQDAQQMKQAVSAFTNAGFGRGLEAANKAIGQPLGQGMIQMLQQHPELANTLVGHYLQHGAQQLVNSPAGDLLRPEDPGNILKGVASMEDYFQKAYINPLKEDFQQPYGANKYAAYLGRRFAASPLGTTFDTGLLHGLGEAGAAMGITKASRISKAIEAAEAAKAAKAARKAEALKAAKAAKAADRAAAKAAKAAKKAEALKAAKAAKALKGGIGEVAAKTAAPIGEAIKGIHPKVAEYADKIHANAISASLLKRANDAYLHRLFTTNMRLHGLEKEILADPELKGVHRYLGEIGEQTDRRLRAHRHHPKIKAYLDEIRKLNKEYEEGMGIQPAEHNRNTIGGQYIAMMKRQGKHLTFDDLKDPKYDLPLAKFAARLRAMGQEPVHFAKMQQQSLLGSLHDAWNRMLNEGYRDWKSGEEAARRGDLAKPALKPSDERFGYLQERGKRTVETEKGEKGNPYGHEDVETLRQPGDSHDTRGLTLERMAHLYRLEATRDYVASYQEYAHVDPDAPEFNLRAEFEKATEKSGAHPSVIQKAFANMPSMVNVRLPQTLADSLRQTLHGSSGPGVIDSILHPFAKGARFAMFTLDPTFGLRLTTQTAALRASAITGPKSLAATLVSHVLAMDPALKDLLPDRIIKSHGSAPDPVLYEARLNMKAAWESGQKLQAALEGLKVAPRAALNLKNKIDYSPNNWQRREFALYLAGNFADKSYKELLSDLFNREDAVNKALLNLEDPNKYMKFEGPFVGHMGDYGVDAAKKWRALGNVLTVQAWVRHSINILKTLPASYPFKTAALHSLIAVQEQLQKGVDDENAKKQGYVAIGHGANKKYVKGFELNAIQSGTDLATTIISQAFSTGDDVTIPSPFNPAIVELVEGLSGTDMGTKKKFYDENPNLRESKGQYYNRETNEYIDRKDLGKHNWPGLAETMFKNQAGKQFSFAAGLAAVDKNGQHYVPSRWLGQPAQYGAYGPIPVDTPAFWLKSGLGITVRNAR